MAEGFKKYFNGTTINGRANVAKATYATLALLFIFYRMRRGSGKELASDKCSCESDSEPMPHGDSGIYGVDPDCSVCRERSERAMSEYDREQQRKAAAEDECRDDPPPPSPPSAGGSGGAAGGRKCPCEESPRRTNAALKHNSSSHAWGQQLQPPNQYQKHFQQHDASVAEQGRPISELMGQAQDAVYRVLCSVFGAVLGGAAVNTTGSNSVGEAQSQLQFGQEGQDEEDGDDGEEQEEEEQWSDGQEYEPRTAPRFCVPTNNKNQVPVDVSTREPEEGASDGYNAFSDGFTS